MTDFDGPSKAFEDPHSDEFLEIFPDTSEHAAKLPEDIKNQMLQHVPRNPWQFFLHKSGQFVILAWIEQEPEERTDNYMVGYLLNKNGRIIKELPAVSSDFEYPWNAPVTKEFQEMYNTLMNYIQAGGNETAVGMLDM